MSFLRKCPLTILLVGFAAGLLAEGMLFMRAHCGAAESALMEDFRVLVLLKPGVSEDKRKIAAERVNALHGSDSVRFVSPEESLAELESYDPDAVRSVALLGENPLPEAFEVRLAEEGLMRMDRWVREAQELEETADVLYKPLEVQAVLQLKFYGGFLAMVLGLFVCLWALVSAWMIWSGWRSGLMRWSEAAAGAASAAAGTAAGVGSALLLASPGTAGAFLHAWPPVWLQAGLVGAGALLGGLYAGVYGTERPASSGRLKSAPRRVLTAAAVAVLLLPALARAASVRRKRRELGRVQAELKEKKNELRKASRRQKALSRDLDTLKKKAKRMQKEVGRLTTRQHEARRRTARLNGRIETIERVRSDERSLLADELRGYALYRAGESDLFRTGELWAESYRRAAIQDKTGYLAQLRMVESRMSAEHEKARLTRAQLEARTRAAISGLKGHQQRVHRKERDFEDVRSRAEAARAKIRKLEQSAKALASLIRKLERSKHKSSKGAATLPVPRNSLPWPVQGKVVSRFGKKRVEELGTWTIHNGIEIAASQGTGVRPVAKGEVIFAGRFRSYGNMVILDHGKGFYSIYGHLSRILSRKGGKVRPDDEFAAVGRKEGSGSGLYLELRRGDVPLNPLAWLENR